MQDHYERINFRHIPNAQLQLSFTGTVMEVMTHLLGPLAQIISSRYGVKVVLIVGTILTSLGLELAAFSTEIWHLYLTQGAIFGAGASLLFTTALSAPPQWFNRRRGLSLGLVSSGTGVGGLVLPFVMTGLNNALGATWTYRIWGLICFGANIISCFLIKEKNQRWSSSNKRLSEVFDLSVIRDMNFIVWLVGSVIAYSGFLVPYFFLPSYVTHLGMSSTDASVFMAALSVSNIIGRISVGFIGDRIGRLNAHLIFTMASGLSSLLIWTFAYSYISIMSFALIFGFFCSSYIALLSPITVAILGMRKFPTGLSVLLLANVVSVFGPSLASGLESVFQSAEPYMVYKMFTGATYLTGALFLLALKIKIAGGLMTKI
ncbi:major facilitator superfamily domain-containing protein [Zychaea mexicana]|uniref:major facilitator superfamily domain-containing protein n=1 Tax=Zychaea mexicana TaxID=64656 RepID=UPI0022FE8843|nr:major facilitator superfamily domain-containing protein [Zychaea mexicana]KAI9498502.1 major facilitator superfamily domain-containing protein [Zychaea mexicana]